MLCQILSILLILITVPLCPQAEGADLLMYRLDIYFKTDPELAVITQQFAADEALFLSETPILPLFWYTRNYLIHPDVKGWDPLILDNHPYKFLQLERNPEL